MYVGAEGLQSFPAELHEFYRLRHSSGPVGMFMAKTFDPKKIQALTD
jgi:hypothetical protein